MATVPGVRIVADVWRRKSLTDDTRQNGSLHVLPLGILPLKTPAFRRARLVKNARLEGVVELFNDENTGAGQIRPDALDTVIQVDEDGRADISTIAALGLLGSYDVYSLRIEIRRLGIEVDFDRHLRLPPETQRSLSRYMSGFTRPLATYVFGDDTAEDRDFQSIVTRFADPNVDTARTRLKDLCRRLEIAPNALPAFLHDYGDVYLSLAYYQAKLDEALPLLSEFEQTLHALEAEREVGKSPRMVKICAAVRYKLNLLVRDVDTVLAVFKNRTRDIWNDPTAARFQEVEDMIRSFQRAIGTALCAITVKLAAWHDRVASSGRVRPTDQISFLMSEMVPGLDNVQRITVANA